jgi:hypothetical protein
MSGMLLMYRLGEVELRTDGVEGKSVPAQSKQRILFSRNVMC